MWWTQLLVLLLYLEDESYDYYSHEETILDNAFEDVLLVWFSSIELVKCLSKPKKKNQINKRACLHAQAFWFQFTYLAENKGVENYRVLHSGGMCRNFMLKAKYAYASEIEK